MISSVLRLLFVPAAVALLCLFLASCGGERAALAHRGAAESSPYAGGGPEAAAESGRDPRQMAVWDGEAEMREAAMGRSQAVAMARVAAIDRKATRSEFKEAEAAALGEWRRIRRYNRKVRLGRWSAVREAR